MVRLERVASEHSDISDMTRVVQCVLPSRVDEDLVGRRMVPGAAGQPK